MAGGFMAAGTLFLGANDKSLLAKSRCDGGAERVPHERSPSATSRHR